MTTVTLAGNPINLAGQFPKVGDTAPGFSLVGTDLANVSLKDFAGKRKVLNICLLYTSPSPRDRTRSRMPSSA